MGKSIIFVVHDDADRDYAVRLVEGLAPLTAVPVRISEETPLRFGQGAVSVILWGPELAARGGAWVLGLLPKSASESALIYCVRGADPAHEFGAYGVQVDRATGEVAPDSEQLKAAIDALRRAAEASQSDSSRRPKLRAVAGASGGAAKPESRGKRLLLRSAFGIAATLGLVAVISHQLGIQRTIASAVPPSSETASPQVAHAGEVPTASQSAVEIRSFSTVAPLSPASVGAGDSVSNQHSPAATNFAAPRPPVGTEPTVVPAVASQPLAQAEGVAGSSTAADPASLEDDRPASGPTSDAARVPSPSDTASDDSSE